MGKNIVSVGEILNMNGNEMEAVFITNSMGRDIVLLHPVDAPKGEFFVPMQINSDALVSVDNPVVAETAVSLYLQTLNRKGIDDVNST